MASAAEKLLEQKTKGQSQPAAPMTAAERLLAEREEEDNVWNAALELAAKSGKQIGKTAKTVSEGALEFLGLPGDIASALQSAYPLPSVSIGSVYDEGGPVGVEPGGGSYQSAIGSAALKKIPEAAGVEFSDPTKPGGLTLRENIEKEIGAGIVPAARIINLGKRLDTAPKLMKNLAGFAANHPVQFMAGEAAVNSTVGAVRTALENMNAGPKTQIAGEILASVIGGTAVGGVERGYSALKRGLGFGESAAATERATGNAAKQLQGVAVDVDEAVRKIDEHLAGQIPGTQHTTAQVTDDLGLIGVERGLATGSPEFRTGMEAQRVATQDALTENIRGISPNASAPQAAADFFEAEAKAVDDVITKRMDDIASDVRRATAHLPPGTAAYRAERSREFADLLEVERAAMERLEGDAWAKVPKTLAADTDKTKAFWERTKEGTSSAIKNSRAEVLPKDIEKTITGWDKYVPVQEIKDLRSVVLGKIRDHKRNPKEGSAQAVAMLNELQAHLLERLNGKNDIAGLFQGAEKKAYDRARAITTRKHDRFETGPVGRLLKYEGDRMKAVDEDVFLESLMKQGMGGGPNVKAIFGAVPIRKAKASLDATLRAQFAESVVGDDGMVDVGAAERFLSAKRYGATLDKLPETKAALEQILTTAKNAEKGMELATEAGNAERAVQRARLYVGRDPQIAFNRALYDAKNPSATMEALVKEAGADASGMAVAGLKRSGIEEIIKGALRASDNSPKGMEKWFARNSKALSKLYSKDEMANINKIAAETKKVLNSRKSAATGSTTAENSILNTVVSNMAASAGSTGTQLFTPFRGLIAQSAGAKIGRAIARTLSKDQQLQLIKDAMLDPELGKELLLRNTDWKQLTRLRGHLFNMGVDIDKAAQEEERQTAKPTASVTTSGLNFV